jgi:hypothetical protein
MESFDGRIAIYLGANITVDANQRQASHWIHQIQPMRPEANRIGQLDAR